MQIINYPIHADGHVSGKIRFFFTKKPGVLPLPAKDKALFFQNALPLKQGFAKLSRKSAAQHTPKRLLTALFETKFIQLFLPYFPRSFPLLRPQLSLWFSLPWSLFQPSLSRWT